MSDAVLTATLPTPLGELTMLVHDDVLVACAFATAKEQHAKLRDPAPLRRVATIAPFTTAMTAYFDGDVTAIDDLPVHQPGGPFRQNAWKLMREIPPGQTISYAELAARAGSPLAARAAGSACALNLIAPVVPCHRVLRGGGALGGYAYGLSRKEWLLAHERGER